MIYGRGVNCIKAWGLAYLSLDRCHKDISLNGKSLTSPFKTRILKLSVENEGVPTPWAERLLPYAPGVYFNTERGT